MTTRMALLLTLLAGALGLPSLARASCDCASPPCSGQTVTVASPAPGSWDTASPDSSWCEGCDAQGRATVTWSFSCDGGSCQCGRFANGDYWVKTGADGRVHITGVSPPSRGSDTAIRNGMVVNPKYGRGQAFDGRATLVGFDAAQNVGNHVDAAAWDSIVKGVSFGDAWSTNNCKDGPGGAHDSHGPCVLFGAVLTILPAAPANGGTTVFRPPFTGDPSDFDGGARPLFSTGDLRKSILPNLDRTAVTGAAAPGDLGNVADTIRGPNFDWLASNTSQYMRPFANNGRSYAQDVSSRINRAALHLVLDYTAAQKDPLITSLTQMGIDLWGMLHTGTWWRPSGGHGTGRLLPIAFAAAILDAAAIQADLHTADGDPRTFAEVGQLRFHPEAGMVLYGTWDDPRLADVGIHCSSSTYWKRINEGKGARWCEDPEGYIDGGDSPGGSYQNCCTSGNWASEVTVARMIPDLERIWIGDTLAYVDRMLRYNQPPGVGGTQASPDPLGRFESAQGKDIVDNQSKMTSSADGFLDIAKQIWGQYRACTPDCPGQGGGGSPPPPPPIPDTQSPGAPILLE